MIRLALEGIQSISQVGDSRVSKKVMPLSKESHVHVKILWNGPNSTHVHRRLLTHTSPHTGNMKKE